MEPAEARPEPLPELVEVPDGGGPAFGEAGEFQVDAPEIDQELIAAGLEPAALSRVEVAGQAQGQEIGSAWTGAARRVGRIGT